MGTILSAMTRPGIAAPPASGWVARAAGWLRGLSRAQTAETPLRVEARLSLGPKKQLLLVDCCGQRVLLAVSGDTVAPVLELGAKRGSAPSRVAGAAAAGRPAGKRKEAQA